MVIIYHELWLDSVSFFMHTCTFKLAMGLSLFHSGYEPSFMALNYARSGK